MKSKKFHHIESPSLCSALKASGLPSTMQRYIFAGTLASLGLNNSKINGTRGIKHIMALMEFCKTDSITGKQLRASLESKKLEVLCSGPLLKNNYPSLNTPSPQNMYAPNP